MNTLLLLASASILGVAGLGIACYKKCSTDELLVKYGVGESKVYSGRGTFIIPYFQSYEIMKLTPQNLDINLSSDSGVVSKDKIKLVIEADATFSISNSEEERIVASKKILSMQQDEIKDMVTEVLTGQVRAIVSDMTLTQLLEDRSMLKGKVSESAEVELTKFGLDLMNFNIKRIVDLDGVIETLGKKASATAQAQAQVDIAEQSKESATKVAEQQREQETAIAKTDAEKSKSIAESQTIKARAIETKETEIAEIESAEKMRRELFVVENERAVSLKRIEAEKELFVKDQEKLQAGLDSKKETAIKEAEVRLENQRAQEIVDTKVENEKRIIEQETELRMQKAKADNDLQIAATKATAIVKEAEAKSKAMKLEADALAEMEALPILRKAEAEKKLKEVYSSEELVQMKLIEILPQLVKYQSEAVANIKYDSINVIGGETNGAVGNEIAGTVNNIIKSLPAIRMANDLAKGINMPSLNITEDIINSSLKNEK